MPLPGISCKPQLMPAAVLRMSEGRAWGAKRPASLSFSSGSGSGSGAAPKRQRRELQTDEEQLTAFEELEAGDVDSQDESPSQDFDGEVLLRGCRGAQGSESSALAAVPVVRECFADSEDASEVFDNVICAPAPAHRYPQPPAETKAPKTPLEAATQHSPIPEDDGDDALSDGFEIDPHLEGALKQNDAVSARPNDSQLGWRQRRSIKRDCTFVDAENSLDGLQVTSSSRSAGSSLRPSIKVIEIDDDDDASIESIEACSLSDRDPEPASRPPPTASSRRPPGLSNQSNTSLVVATRSISFQPRLQKKRRKLEQQLTLDSFFRSRPSS